MTTKEEYEKAQKIVWDYEDQMEVEKQLRHAVDVTIKEVTVKDEELTLWEWIGTIAECYLTPSIFIGIIYYFSEDLSLLEAWVAGIVSATIGSITLSLIYVTVNILKLIWKSIIYFVDLCRTNKNKQR